MCIRLSASLWVVSLANSHNFQTRKEVIIKCGASICSEAYPSLVNTTYSTVFYCGCPPEVGFDRIDVCGGWCMWYCTSEIFWIWNRIYIYIHISSRYLKHAFLCFRYLRFITSYILPTKKRVLKDVPPTWSKHRSGGSSFEGGGGRSFGSAGDGRNERDTPWKINMELENDGLEDDVPFQLGDF